MGIIINNTGADEIVSPGERMILKDVEPGVRKAVKIEDNSQKEFRSRDRDDIIEQDREYRNKFK